MTAEESRASQREYQRWKTAQLKAAGLCTYCGKRPAEPRGTMCWQCRQYSNARGRLSRKKQIKLCSDCGQPLPSGYTHRRCPDCAKQREELEKAQWKARYYTRKMNHQCPVCGAQLPEDWKKITCQDCLAKKEHRHE